MKTISASTKYLLVIIIFIIGVLFLMSCHVVRPGDPVSTETAKAVPNWGGKTSPLVRTRYHSKRGRY